MTIQCFYKGQRAVFKGVDKLKHTYLVKTEDGQNHYPKLLEKIEFRNHSTDQELFNTISA